MAELNSERPTQSHNHTITCHRRPASDVPGDEMVDWPCPTHREATITGPTPMTDDDTDRAQQMTADMAQQMNADMTPQIWTQNRLRMQLYEMSAQLEQMIDFGAQLQLRMQSRSSHMPPPPPSPPPPTPVGPRHTQKISRESENGTEAEQ